MSDEKHGNPILTDRRSHMNSNGFVLGTSGAGKSFNPVPTEIQKLVELVKVDADGSIGVKNAPFNVITRSIACFDSPLGSRLPGLAFLDKLTHADGTPARFRELFEDPSAHSLGRGSGKCWSEERGSYECFVSERPYESRPERAIVLDGHAWNLLAESYGDLLGEQSDGFLCLQFVFHGPDNDFRFDPFDGFLHRRDGVGGGGAMV